MMKWPWLILCLLFSFTVFGSEKLEFFTGPDCPKCEHAQAALVAYQGTHPELDIVAVNVFDNKDNLNRLRYLGLKHRFDTLSLPAFYYHSTLKAGMSQPNELIVWLEETSQKSQGVGEVNLFGSRISYEKSGLSTFSALLALKDFFMSIWGIALIACSVLLVLSQKKFEAVIGALCFSVGGIVASVLWSLPSTRVLFAQSMMFDLIIAGVLLLAAVIMIIKTKKYSLSGWSELALFCVGIIAQRLSSLFSGFEFLRLQDVLFESRVSALQQAGMSIVYGLVQFFLMIVVIFALGTIAKRKNGSVAKIS